MKPKRLVAAIQFNREFFDEESARLWVHTHHQRVYRIKFFPKSILILTRPASDFLPDTFKSRHVEPGVLVRSGLSNKQKNPDEGDDSEEGVIEDEDVEIAISEALEDRYDDMLAELKDSDGEVAEELFSAFEEQYFGEQDTSELYELIDDSGYFSQKVADYWDNLGREEAELLLLEAGPSLYEIKYENDINRKRRGILKKWTDDEMRTSVIDPPQDYIPLVALGLSEDIEKEASMWSDYDLQRIIGMGSSFINTEVQGGVFYGEVELPGYFYIVLRQEEFENLLLGKLTEPVKEDIVYEYPSGFYVAKLTTAKQLRDEGRKLGHCIGRERYIKQAKLGDREFYSLRTAGGKSKFTIEVVPKRKRDATYPVKQIKGKNNRLPGLTHTQSEKLAYEPGHLVKIALAINKGILSEDTPLPIYLRQGPMFSIWEADTEGHPDEDKGLAITEDLVEQFLEMFDGGFKPTEVYLIAEFLVDYLNINENGNYFGGNDFYRQWAWVNWNNIPRPNPMGCELEDEDEDVYEFTNIEDGVTKAEAYALGRQLGVDFRFVDIEEFRMGIEVEREHFDVSQDPLVIARIVLAHLKEMPDYYTRLREMEHA